MDALQLAQRGFPVRIQYDEFLDKYKAFVLQLKPDEKAPARDQSTELLRKHDVPSSDYREGFTRIFLRKEAALWLEAKRKELNLKGESLLQDVLRVRRARRVNKTYEASMHRLDVIQAHMRGFQQRIVTKPSATRGLR